MVFFVVVLIITINFTGDLVSEGKLSPGGTYESNFTLTDTKDLTFIFSAPEVSVHRIEELGITITYPNGSKTSWTKGFATTVGRPAAQKGKVIWSEAIWSEDSDSTFIIKPTITGIYYLRITDAKFPTDLKIRSGMVNVLKEDLFFVVLILSSLVMVIFLFMGDKIGYNLPYSPSKKGFLIALLVSLVITFTTVYYSSM